jgi:ATP-dependent Clp protease ATP-binding subunit ClpA
VPNFTPRVPVFTRKAQQFWGIAGTEAKRRNHLWINDDHLFYAELQHEDSLASRVLKGQGSYEAVLARATWVMEHLPTAPPSDSIPLTPKANGIWAIAGAESKRLGHQYIADDHFFYAELLYESSRAETILKEQGCYEAVLALVTGIVESLPPELPSAGDADQGSS